MSNSEWVKIPEMPNYEVNCNGEIRNQDNKVQAWGRKFFLWGAEHNRARIAIYKAMRDAFGDEAVDNSNAIRVPKK